MAISKDHLLSADEFSTAVKIMGLNLMINLETIGSLASCDQVWPLIPSLLTLEFRGCFIR